MKKIQKKNIYEKKKDDSLVKKQQPNDRQAKLHLVASCKDTLRQADDRSRVAAGRGEGARGAWLTDEDEGKRRRKKGGSREGLLLNLRT